MAWKPPFMRIPRWHQRPSGLLIPTKISRPVITESGPPLPPGVEMPEPDLFIVGGFPTSADQMRVFMEETGLKLSVSTPDEFKEMVAELSFESTMVALARLSATVSHLRGDTTAQTELAESVFGNRRLIAQVKRLAKSSGPKLEIFAEQHITAFQRQLVLSGKDVPLDEHDPTAEQPIFDRALVAASCLTAAEHLGTDTSGDERAKWLAYLVQNGTYHRHEGQLESMVRPQILLRDIAQSPPLRDDPDYCDIDSWLETDKGFGISDQFALGFAVSAGAKAFDDDAEPGDRSLLSPKYLPDLVQRLGRDEQKAMELLTASRSWYAARFDQGDQTVARAAWDRVAFDLRPFLRLTEGPLLLISPRAIENWLGDGFFHRCAAAARQRGDEPKFRRFYGSIVETYALQLMRWAHPDPRPPGSGRVFGEQRYGKGGGQKSPDISVDCGHDLVLVEVTSGRFTLRTLLDGDPGAALADLRRLAVEKVAQLGRRISDLKEGKWTVPDVDIEKVQRIWPVVVTADILQNELLWDEVLSTLPDTLTASKVEHLTFLDLPDLEQLAALVEKGHGLGDLISRKASGLHAQLDFRRFVADEADLSTDVRLSMLEDRWGEAIAEGAGALGVDVGGKRVRAHMEKLKAERGNSPAT